MASAIGSVPDISPDDVGIPESTADKRAAINSHGLHRLISTLFLFTAFLVPFGALSNVGVVRALSVMLAMTSVFIVATNLQVTRRYPAVVFAPTGLTLFALLQSHHKANMIQLALVAAAAFCIGVRFPSNFVRKLTTLIASIAIVVGGVEVILQNHFYQEIFGSEYLWYDGSGFRARSVFGHPLVAGTVVFGLLLPVISETLERSFKSFAITLSATVVFVFLTGSRSVLLLTIFAIALLWRKRSKLQNKSLSARSTRIWLLVVLTTLQIATAAAFAASLGLIGDVALPRAVGYEGFSRGQSFLVRSSALNDIHQLNQTLRCDVTCDLVGHGFRAAQDNLRLLYGRDKISTVDNMYLTLSFDFGAIGLAGVVFLALAWWRVARLEHLTARQLGAIVSTASFLLASLVFDILYWIPTLTALFLNLGIAYNENGPHEPITPDLGHHSQLPKHFGANLEPG